MFNKKYVLAKQLLRSGTSIGANRMEVQNVESRTEFIHNIKIEAKEAEETQYWLWPCDYSTSYPGCRELINKLEEINKVPGKILTTAKRKNPVSYLMSLRFFNPVE